MNEPSNRLGIVALQGTTRPGSYTAHALAVVVDELEQRHPGCVTIVDPSTLSLPFPGQTGEYPDVSELQDTVRGATGVVFATPEYHGTFSSVAKLLVENLGFPSALSTKPVALLGVAAGSIGAIKSLESLRGVCSHVGAIVLPGPVSIANVRSAFDADGRVIDETVDRQLRALASSLLGYIEQSVCPRFALETMVRQGAA